MNYLILVNRDNLIDDNYYEIVDMIECNDIRGNLIKVETITYYAYLKLKEFLKSIGIYIEIESAYRSFNCQQDVIDEYLIKYGKDYTSKYVAPIRTSEHHTGLAIDLGVIIDGKKIYEPNDIFKYEDVFLQIHKYLSKFGFILRYPKGSEKITGYNYEPWHIRYVGKNSAVEIMKKGITLEEYIGDLND